MIAFTADTYRSQADDDAEKRWILLVISDTAFACSQEEDLPHMNK